MFCSNTCGNNTNSNPGGGCSRASYTNYEQCDNSGRSYSTVCTGPGHAIFCPRCDFFFVIISHFFFLFFFYFSPPLPLSSLYILDYFYFFFPSSNADYPTGPTTYVIEIRLWIIGAIVFSHCEARRGGRIFIFYFFFIHLVDETWRPLVVFDFDGQS